MQQADALHLRGLQAYQAGKFDAAEDLIRQAIAVNPSAANLHCNLASVLSANKKLDAAIAACRTAISLRPDYPEALSNLGNALRAAERFDEAVQPLQKATALRPDFVEALNGLANALMKLGRVEEAVAAYRRVVALQPNTAGAHYNLAHALLLMGNYAEGWPEFDWRRRDKALSPSCQEFPQPIWDGGELNGKRILLHAEEGFGDTIQFVRFVPQVKSRGGKILLACPPELVRLMKNLAGVEQVLTNGDDLPPIDVHCPLLSLPGVLKVTVETIPTPIPYLHSDSEKWAGRLKSYKKLKVGLAWQGRPEHSNDRNRSISPQLLSPLLELADVHFFSLQKGRAAPPPMIDWTADLCDFADTGGLIDNLDLLIAVDTSVVHLAGAMGKPVFVLLPFAPDWRWMLHRADSPWYPTARLFRQPQIGDWATPIAQAAAALREFSRVRFPSRLT